MQEKRFLNEENYQKSKRKIIIIAVVVLVIGVLIGGSLIAAGIIKTNEVKKQNEKTAQLVEENNKTRTEADIQADIDKIQLQIDQIDSEIMTLETEESKLRNEKSRIFQEDKNFSDRYYAKDEEITAKENEIKAKEKEKSKLEESLSDYETELWEVTSGYGSTKKEFEKNKNMISTYKYSPFYIFGGFIIIASCIAAISIYTFAKGRDILAFTANQTVPVTKEVIEDIAPSIGKAAGSFTKEMNDIAGESTANVMGDIAKNISKGIKEGINEADKDKK